MGKTFSTNVKMHSEALFT